MQPRWVRWGFGRRIPPPRASPPNPCAMRWLHATATVPNPGPARPDLHTHTHTHNHRHTHRGERERERQNGARPADPGGHHLDHHLRGRHRARERGQGRPLHQQGQRRVRACVCVWVGGWKDGGRMVVVSGLMGGGSDDRMMETITAVSVTDTPSSIHPTQHRGRLHHHGRHLHLPHVVRTTCAYGRVRWCVYAHVRRRSIDPSMHARTHACPHTRLSPTPTNLHPNTKQGRDVDAPVAPAPARHHAGQVCGGLGHCLM